MIETLIEVFRILLFKRKLNKSELGRMLGISRQTMNTKLNKENYNVKELIELAGALDCDLEISFIMKDTRERLTASTEDSQ